MGTLDLCRKSDKDYKGFIYAIPEHYRIFTGQDVWEGELPRLCMSVTHSHWNPEFFEVLRWEVKKRYTDNPDKYYSITHDDHNRSVVEHCVPFRYPNWWDRRFTDLTHKDMANELIEALFTAHCNNIRFMCRGCDPSFTSIKFYLKECDDPDKLGPDFTQNIIDAITGKLGFTAPPTAMLESPGQYFCEEGDCKQIPSEVCEDKIHPDFIGMSTDNFDTCGLAITIPAEVPTIEECATYSDPTDNPIVKQPFGHRTYYVR